MMDNQIVIEIMNRPVSPEAKLEALLEIADQLDAFPKEAFIQLGKQLDLIQIVPNLGAGFVSIETAIDLNMESLYVELSKASSWQKVLESARKWCYSHLDPEKALAFYNELTVHPPDEKPNLHEIVRFGIRGGLSQRLYSPQRSHAISVEDAAYLCFSHITHLEIEGDGLKCLGLNLLSQVGPWMPMFELILRWREKYLPLLPKVE